MNNIVQYLGKYYLLHVGDKPKEIRTAVWLFSVSPMFMCFPLSDFWRPRDHMAHRERPGTIHQEVHPSRLIYSKGIVRPVEVTLVDIQWSFEGLSCHLLLCRDSGQRRDQSCNPTRSLRRRAPWQSGSLAAGQRAERCVLLRCPPHFSTQHLSYQSSVEINGAAGTATQLFCWLSPIPTLCQSRTIPTFRSRCMPVISRSEQMTRASAWVPNNKWVCLTEGACSQQQPHAWVVAVFILLIWSKIWNQQPPSPANVHRLCPSCSLHLVLHFNCRHQCPLAFLSISPPSTRPLVKARRTSLLNKMR